MKIIYYFYLLIAILTLQNCGKTDKVDTKFVKEALKGREIKKVSEAEIVEAGLKRGQEDAHSFVECNNIKPTTFRSCLDSSRSSLINTFIIATSEKDLQKTEAELYKAYQYNFNEKQDLYPNYQDLKDGTVLYSTPIYLYEGDLYYYDKKIEGKSLSSFAIIFIHYSKKKLILEL